MSIEGLWAAEFGHAGAAFKAVNGGIAVLESGRVFGGDSWFAYTGTYELTDNGVAGTLKVRRHHDDPQSIDAWGTGKREFGVKFQLNWIDHLALGEGVMQSDERTLGLRLRKLDDLP